MKVIAMIGACLLAATAAGAQPHTASMAKDGAISVNPGRYKWVQDTSVIGWGDHEENVECLIPEEARITLSKLASDLQKGCTVDNVVPISGGYNFKLICKGKISGDAKATLTHTSTSMKIRAEGTVSLAFIPAGFSMKADATYVGACSAEESRKALERYKRENNIR